MKLITFISAGAFIFLSAFVIKNNHEKQTASLYYTKWSLKKIYTETGVSEVQTKAFIKFNEEKQSAGGNGSCNTFGSNITLDGNKIVFTNIFSTKMYCEGVQQTEDLFFKLLAQVTRFEVKDKNLLLSGQKGVLLELVAE